MTDQFPSKKILIVAGEASGDQHAAALVQEMNRITPGRQFCGMGGDMMKQAGVELLYHIGRLAVIGFTEVLKHLPLIHRIQKRLEAEMDAGVAAVILVDYPGFNLRIARIAKKKGVPVIYYISPQLWAWREKRVEKIRKYVDLMLVLFKFEVDFYRKHGIEARFVGHPLIDHFPPPEPEAQFRERYGIHPEKPILGLFPGSRKMEVEHLLRPMAEAAEIVQNRVDCEVVVSRAAHVEPALFREVQNRFGRIRLADCPGQQLMQHCYAAYVASGTATLELGYARVPMVVLYRVSPLTYRLGRFLIKIDMIALVNIVAGEKIVPEFIQKDIDPENLAGVMQRYFEEPSEYQAIREKLARIRGALGDPGASRRAAQHIVQFLKVAVD